jgi:peptide-methionine (S)-S-oxide reductase
VHDPTTMNRQGNDVGSQYRSAIFYHNEAQKIIAEQVIKEINDAHIWDRPIVTEVKPYTRFYSAEDYHRDYFERNPQQNYCQIVIAPKVTKFRKKWAAKLKA